ncbi:MAG: hypothetical protein IJZ25_04705, partial [Lachnospiraceae bacterium]|nr:hypothetical protein [Lachnospiraceae bacterium]
MKSVVKNEKKSKSIYSWGLNFRAVKIFIVFFLFAVTIAAVAEYSSVRGNFYKESQSVIYSYEDGIYTVSYPDYWEEKYGEDESRPVDISYILDVSQKGPCLFISVLATVFIGIVLVQRESFGNNWHWTLRRIPKYRLIYLFSKLSLVLIPGGIYWLIYMAEA